MNVKTVASGEFTFRDVELYYTDTKDDLLVIVLKSGKNVVFVLRNIVWFDVAD